MNSVRKAFRALSFALLVLLSLNVCWAAAWLLIAAAFGRTGGWTDGLVRQLAASTAGFAMFGAVLAVMSRLAYPGHTARFRSVIDAMGRLSRGDYSVSLDMAAEAGGQFAEFARSFNAMAAQLGTLEKMRQEFVSNVSHEIRSPLTSIAGFARALRSEGLSAEERDRCLGIIETECMRLSRLSDNLLRLAVLESDLPPFEPARYRLDRQIREAVLACEPQWLGKSLEMDVSLEPVEIVADPDLLNQVWANLLHNSIKFTPHGGTIGVRLRLAGGMVEVVVSDTGIGIGEEDLPRIFERFHKADRSRNREAGGSGLGLAIVKKIVDLHHGTIGVESKPGEGAVFTVRLPVREPGKTKRMAT